MKDKWTQKEYNALAIMVRAYYDYQRERIELDGKLGQKKDGTRKKKSPDRENAFLVHLQERRDDVLAMEESLEKDIAEKVVINPGHKLWHEFLVNVKGVGPIMTGVILSEFDIEKSVKPSNMISFAGMAPGKDRKEKGKKCPFNQFLRSRLLGVLAGQFLKAKSMPYSSYYYDTKMRYENSFVEVKERLRREDRKKKQYKGMKERMVAWKDAYPDHRHKAANRKMLTMFIKDLYVAWRTLEGLPVSVPYEEQYLGKVHGKVKAA